MGRRQTLGEQLAGGALAVVERGWHELVRRLRTDDDRTLWGTGEVAQFDDLLPTVEARRTRRWATR